MHMDPSTSKLRVEVTNLTSPTTPPQQSTSPSQEAALFIDYAKMDERMRLARLEEKANLAIALRHLVRTLHECGTKISFPSPEAQNRLALRLIGLLSIPKELLELVRQPFRRRN